MTILRKRWRFGFPRAFGALSALLAAAAMITAVAPAASTAAPQSSSAPTISGQAREGRTLTAATGTWTNSPTGFTYQWQQCDASGASCTALSGATSKTYTIAKGDADHTIRVAVTATNADGSSTTMSQPTAVVSSANA